MTVWKALPATLLLLAASSAQAGDITVKVKGAAFGGQVVAVSTAGIVLDSAEFDDDNSARLTVSGTYTLQFIDSSNSYAGPGFALCSGKATTCKTSSSKVPVGFKKRSGALSFSRTSGTFKYSAKTAAAGNAVKGNVTATAQGKKPLATGANLGLALGSSSETNARNPSDSDFDGVIDVYDVDDDGDGIIDNYDDTPRRLSSRAAAVEATSFSLFSNLKLSIDTSLNLSAKPTLTQAEIDAALSGTGSLAIQVAEDELGGSSTELDCGTLSYCAAGGTGASNSTEFPEGFDGDSDGFGTIVKGATNDFQLQHGATSSQIGGGDTFVQYVTASDSTETKVPGMLNFVFNTTPALKTVAVNGGAVQTVDYTASPRLGSSTNCIAAPASGAVTLDLVVWPPQRPGNAAASEASFVDIGNSLITIDIPNLPCSLGGGGGCPGAGPGNCTAAAYTNPSSGMTVGTDGIEDGNADADHDATVTRGFSVNLATCLGASSWAAGDTLFVDIQFRSKDGDNAAQKVCVQRAAS